MVRKVGWRGAVAPGGGRSRGAAAVGTEGAGRVRLDREAGRATLAGLEDCRR